MCSKCAMAAMFEDDIQNPNPQEGRVYPKGWDLAGYETPEAFGARYGSESDDTLRMVFLSEQTCLLVRQIAEGFTGHAMELFYDGKFYCYRPAIYKRNRPQPPAWHVMKYPEGYPQVSEEQEIQARAAFEDMLKDAGYDPDDVFGAMGDLLPDEDDD